MLGITQIFYLGVGVILLGGGTWDILKIRSTMRDADAAILSRWSSIAIIVFGLILFISGLTQVFGNTVSA